MSFIDKLVSKFNSEDVIKFSDKDGFKEIESWAHTGCPELDYNLGVWGLPTGMVEIAGPSKSGKTTLGLIGMKNFMDQNPDNGVAIILSSENRDNREYATRIGIDVDKVIIMKIRYVEKMFLMVKSVIQETNELFDSEKLGKPKFYFLWDSLGATLSKSELDTMEANTEMMEKKMLKGEEMEKLKHEKIGAFAKPAKMFAKFLTGEMYDKTIHFIMLNHVYDKIGGMGKKSTGGEWVELMPTLRLRMGIFKHEKIDDAIVAQISRVTVEKNDFGSRRETRMEILLGHGIVLNEADIKFGIEQGLIEKISAKKHEAFGGKLTWNSKRTFYQLYWGKNKWMKALHTKIKKARHEEVIAERESYD